MIEYMYSRMIATFASIAIVSIVVSASIGAIQQSDMECTKKVAGEISQLIELVGKLHIRSFEQRLVIDEDGTHNDLVVSLNHTHIIVQNRGFECSKSFEVPIILISKGEISESLTAVSGSIIIIKASNKIFDQYNEIIIEVLGRDMIT